MASPITLIAATALVSLLLYRYLLHPILLSPLGRIPPAHWSTPLSPLWILSTRHARRENTTVHAAHQRLGPLIRLGPNEISVNAVDGGIRTVYGGGYEKGDWYSVFTNYGGVRNTFSSLGHAEHSARKRMLSNVYAKSTVHASVALRAVAAEVLCRRLLPRLDGAAGEGRVVEAYELFSGAAMDFVTGYIFGLGRGSEFLLDEERCKTWVVDYKARQEFTFWPQELPNLTAWLARVGVRVVPRWVDVANRNIEAWVMGLCEGAEEAYLKGQREGKGLAERERSAVYSQLRQMKKKANGGKDSEALTEKERMEIASEVLDHAAAGFDTTGITLTYLAWELSKPENKKWQDSLRDELRASPPQYRLATYNGGAEDMPDFKTLDALPILHAIVMETLRLHAAIPGAQPRITPENAELGVGETCVKGIPAGVRVNSQGYSLHLNEEVFPHAERWLPSRWLDDKGRVDGAGEKSRWFWAFGSGGRMCIGSNLAMTEMKSIVAAIWVNFSTLIADDTGMTHCDGYTAEPLGTSDGDYLILRIQAAA